MAFVSGVSGAWGCGEGAVGASGGRSAPELWPKLKALGQPGSWPVCGLSAV